MNSTTIGRDNAERIFTLDLVALARAIQLDPALRITHRHSMPTRNGLAWSALIGGAIEACDDGHGGMISLRVHERRHDDADATLAALQRVARLFGIEISPTTRGSLVDDPTEDTGLLISAMLDATEASQASYHIRTRALNRYSRSSSGYVRHAGRDPAAALCGKPVTSYDVAYHDAIRKRGGRPTLTRRIAREPSWTSNTDGAQHDLCPACLAAATRITEASQADELLTCGECGGSEIHTLDWTDFNRQTFVGGFWSDGDPTRTSAAYASWCMDCQACVDVAFTTLAARRTA